MFEVLTAVGAPQPGAVDIAGWLVTGGGVLVTALWLRHLTR
jgi:hypothetical protein